VSSLALRDLIVGQVDAKHEWLNDIREDTNFMSDSFVLPDNVDPEAFLRGRVYFVTGLKGTGKTALLRYISTCVRKKPDHYTEFVLFKSEVTEEDRKLFSRLSDVSLVDESKVVDQKDFELVWRWFFYRKIAAHLDLNPGGAFIDNKARQKFIAAIRSAYMNQPASKFCRFIPKLKKGRLGISGGAKALAAELGVEFEWDDKDETMVRFSSLVSIADQLFEQLTPGTAWYYIFVDELELAYGSRKQFNRDCRIIRDLIVTIDRLNSIATVKRFNLRLTSAVRSEVLTAVSSLGKEINKVTTDYGIPLFWHRGGQDYTQQPLLDIIKKKLESSEKLAIGYIRDGSVWDKFFPQHLHREDTRAFLLHNSWYRPRDFVRLLSIAKQQDPGASRFSQRVLDHARKSYSIENWTEIAEELQPAYTIDEIEGIKRIFTGFKRNFTFSELNQHLEEKKLRYQTVATLCKKRELSRILEDLFRVGVVGNYYFEKWRKETRSRNRWAFRGDDQILLEKRIAIHKGLLPAFSLA